MRLCVWSGAPLTSGVMPVACMAKYCAYLILLVSLAFIGCSSTRLRTGNPPQSRDDGMPFGKITEADTDHLFEFAKGKDFDLAGELQKAYDKDPEALARVFTFSLAFHSLDQ